MNSQTHSPKKKKPIGYRVVALIMVIVLYIGSYAVLSYTGGWIVSESGEFRTVMAASDVFLWQPRYGSGQWFRNVGDDHGFRGDVLGAFYSPLILFDQRYVHPTVRFREPDGTAIKPLPAPPLAEYHPLRINRFYGRWPYEVPMRDKKKS